KHCLGEVEVAAAGERIETAPPGNILLFRKISTAEGSQGRVGNPGWIAQDEDGFRQRPNQILPILFEEIADEDVGRRKRLAGGSGMVRVDLAGEGAPDVRQTLAGGRQEVAASAGGLDE